MIYDYTVVRSARKSISVSVASDNTITVRCPWSLSVERINEFLDGKAQWIEKAVSENCRRLAANDDIVEGRKIYVFGQKYELLTVGNKDFIGDGKVYVKNKSGLKKLYTDTFSKDFLNRINAFSDKLVLKANGISFNDYKSRWGCCDAANNLIFNYKIFMLPQRLQDYVIVHELCHTICHNHSHAFWALVREGMPDYKTRKEELKYYDFLVGLY